ncbi:MAG: ATP phosphoribosyltransferase, partial [Bacteroidota bacterium]
MTNAPLRIALQKSGRLSEQSHELLRECGIKYHVGKRTLIAKSTTFPLEILLLRDDDIPQYVEDGTAHLGILGENVVVEKVRQIEMVKRLGFAKCRLSIAIPKNEVYLDVSYFEGKTIATSYRPILERFLEGKVKEVTIKDIGGSVEIAPNIGLADGIFDIVSTGGTLRSNGLKEVEKVMGSEAVIIANKHLNEAQQELVDELLFRIDTVFNGRKKIYVMLNAQETTKEKIIDLLPGVTAPTIMPLN